MLILKLKGRLVLGINLVTILCKKKYQPIAWDKNIAVLWMMSNLYQDLVITRLLGLSRL